MYILMKGAVSVWVPIGPTDMLPLVTQWQREVLLGSRDIKFQIFDRRGKLVTQSWFYE